MKTLFALAILAISSVSFGAVDNFYTRLDYPQPRVKQASDNRVFPAFLAYVTDGNGSIQPMGPVTLDSFKYATAVASPIATTGTTVIKAATSGTKANYISGLQVSNTGGAASVISLVDGSTVIWSGNIPATSGQLTLAFDPPLKGTASTATSFVVNSGASSLLVSAQGFVR